MFGGQVPFHGDHATEDRVQVGHGQVRTYLASALRALQKPAERTRQRGRGVSAGDADAGPAQGAGQGDVLLRLGGEFPDEIEEGRGWVGGVSQSVSAGGEAGQPIGHDGGDQGFLGREMAVHRPGSHPGSFRDDIEGNVGALVRE